MKSITPPGAMRIDRTLPFRSSIRVSIHRSWPCSCTLPEGLDRPVGIADLVAALALEGANPSEEATERDESLPVVPVDPNVREAVVHLPLDGVVRGVVGIAVDARREVLVVVEVPVEPQDACLGVLLAAIGTCDTEGKSAAGNLEVGDGDLELSRREDHAKRTHVGVPVGLLLTEKRLQ